MGTISPELRQPEREADYSHTHLVASLRLCGGGHPIVLVGLSLIKNRKTFLLIFSL